MNAKGALLPMMFRHHYRRTVACLLIAVMLIGAVACTNNAAVPADTTAAVSDTTAEEGASVTDIPTDTETDADTMPASLTPEELAARLAASPYAEPLTAAGFVGLTDPSTVGIDRTADGIKYPVPADGDCARVYNVADRGITPQGTDNAAKFNALMQELASVEGVKKVVFPAGVYPFEATLKIDDVDDLYICSDKPDTLFEISITTWCQGISVSNCRNLHLSDFAFDYATPTAVTGTVVSSTTNRVVIRIDEGYDLTDPRYNGGKISYGSYMEFKLDKATGKYVPDPKGNLLYNSTGDQIQSITDGSYDPATGELTLTFRTLNRVSKDTRVNVAYTMYEYFGMYATGCTNIYLENANFYHTAGMTFGADNTENIYLNRFKLSPRDGRLMTATADGLHFNTCTGEIVLTNSVLEYSHDDCLNIKGPYAKVGNLFEYGIEYEPSPDIHLSVGDVVDMYEIATFRYVGSFTVTGLEGALGKNVCSVKEPVPAGPAGEFMICNASRSPSFTAQNCFFGNKRNRGMLIQCRDVEISNCTFQNIVHGAIQILSVADIFAEGIMPRDVVVKNNKFLGNAIEDVHIFTWGRGGTTSGTITGVTVTNNYFYGTGKYPVDILGAGDCAVTGNLFYDHAVRNAVLIRTSERITVTNNLSLPARAAGYKTVNTDRTATAVTVTDNYIGDKREDA